MISRLTGILCEKNTPSILIDVAGVGYEVEVSMNTLFKLPEIGQKICLHTHFVVREDAQLLYGFYDKRERTLFRSLIKVNGVGPKLAIAILSSINPDEFVRSVHEHDTASLVKIPGVGKKTAERLIVEMHDRLPDWQFEINSHATSDVKEGNDVIVRKRVIQDAVSALIALGYKPQEASRAVSSVSAEGKSSEILIRDALKNIGSG